MRGRVEGVALGVSQEVLRLACGLAQLPHGIEVGGQRAEIAGEVSLRPALLSYFANLHEA